MRILLEFDRFPDEQSIIGKLLMCYTELEFNVAKLVSHAVGDDNHGARILFRVNGEAARLVVADAIVRPFFDKMKLGGQWSNAFGAMKYCKDVRNQYAHCHWYSQDGQPLQFINLEKDVASPEEILTIQTYPTDLDLLEKQRKYFEYANSWLYFLDCRCRRTREIEAPNPPVPKSIPQPPKHNRETKPPAKQGE